MLLEIKVLTTKIPNTSYGSQNDMLYINGKVQLHTKLQIPR